MQTPGVPDHASPLTGLKYDVVGPDAVEPKTTAATGGAGVGGVIAGAILWGMDELWWNGEAAPDVPGPLAALVWAVVPAGVAFLASYYARHVNRVR